MNNRAKEEERIETIIRGLLKLPENKRCINCDSLGPQYVCTTFWTFVCTTCSGVHREFTHRVKSVSMAKFNAEEVDSLQAGGNERARDLYFKTWDPLRNSLPDHSNLPRLREFVRHVYLERKYTGEHGSGKLAIVKTGSPFESNGSRCQYYDRHCLERSSTVGKNEPRNLKSLLEDRSPRYEKKLRSSSSNRSRSARFEIVDDRFRDNDYGGVKRFESRRFSGVENRTGSLPTDYQRYRERIRIPEVHPVKELLGNDVPRLRIDEAIKATIERRSDAALAQKTATSTSQQPVHKKGVGQKPVNLTSLIDFDAEPELPDNSALAQTQRTDDGKSSIQPSSQEKALNPPNPPTQSSVESLLFGLSDPADVPIHSTPEILSTSSADASSTTPKATETAPTIGNNPALLSNNGDLVVANNDSQLLLTTHPLMLSGSPSIVSSSASPHSQSIEASPNQNSWLSSTSVQGLPSNASTEQSSHIVSKIDKDTGSADGVKPTARKELPEDIFTTLYPSYSLPTNWQFHPPPGMGSQFHPTALPVPGFSKVTKSMNPFDISDEAAPVQTSMFPSMVSLHGALPHVSAHVGLQPQPSPYGGVALPSPQPSSYGLTMSSGAYVGQQLPNNMLVSKPEAISRSGSIDSAFNPLNPLEPSSSPHIPAAANSYSSSKGGNPFG